MAYLIPQDRFQVQMRSMDEAIGKDNAVRFIDAFVAHLELAKLGFVIPNEKTEGRPAFNPKVFLKLYFYGYLNGIRSSRKLEKEAIRNIEVHWLLCRRAASTRRRSSGARVWPRRRNRRATGW